MKNTRPLDVPNERWAEAVRRAAVVRSLAANERNSRNNVSAAAHDLGLSIAQLYRLIKTFREKPVAQALVLDKPGPRKGARRLSTEVETIVDQAINRVYKRRERPSKQKLMQEIWADCREAGLKSPSMKAVSARVDAQPIKEIITAREGAKTAHNLLAPVRSGLRPTAPLEIVQIDHTPVDILLVDDFVLAPIGRPYLTLLFDVYSRCVLGFVVTFDPPSAAGVALAIAQGVLPKGKWLTHRGLQVEWPVHGIPKMLHLDNAQEFHSQALTRGCDQYGILLDYRPPGAPRFGGHIERVIGTLMQRVHALPGTTSSTVVDRANYPSEHKAILTLAKFERIFAHEVLGIYHNQLHSELGKTPLAMWAEGIARVGTPRLPVNDPEAVVLDFLPFEERKVGREGVRLFTITYFADGLDALIRSPDRKRRVKYDPRDMSAVFVEMPDGGHIRAPYADMEKPPIALWEYKAARRRLRELGRGTVNEDAVFLAIMDNRQTLVQAQSKSNAARRASARSPTGRIGVSVADQFAPENRESDSPTDESRVPQVNEHKEWETEVLW